jgi:hypothetical protein
MALRCLMDEGRREQIMGPRVAESLAPHRSGCGDIPTWSG